MTKKGYCSLPCKSSSSVNNNTLRDAHKTQKQRFWRCDSPVFCDFRFAALTKNTSRLLPVNSNKESTLSLSEEVPY